MGAGEDGGLKAGERESRGALIILLKLLSKTSCHSSF